MAAGATKRRQNTMILISTRGAGANSWLIMLRLSTQPVNIAINMPLRGMNILLVI